MVRRGEDETLQAHRGSYKTTCVSVALALIMLVYPNDKILFMRKTNSDVIEVIAQVKKIIKSDIFRQMSLILWGVEIELIVERSDCLVTNLAGNDPRGTPQLMGMGTQASLTGKHFDRIFTDDIVNIEDRVSKAERDRTKIVYQELQNIKNRGGRIYNTGTPWHKDDAFTLMPNPIQWDCYSTGLISHDELTGIRSHMEASLFAANYELKHIASEDVIFDNPRLNADVSLVEQGVCHIDASYGGSDGTAFTICHKADGKYYVLGKLWKKHVDDCQEDIIKLRKALNAGRISMETNGDKGYLSKSLRAKGERTHPYHENMNKYLKITSYLKAEWENVYFVAGTDREYIDEVLGYNENAEHDDAPDSLSSIVRELWSKKASTENIDTTGLIYY
ncbi:MAG: hypothetical protein KBT15_06210 [Bacteroidales bacterium]|nr:hypothetical protein [Candidatus Minthousia equi]